MTRIAEGPVWLETIIIIFLEIPWRDVYEWILIAAIALIAAVALLATFQPLYDLMHWKGL